MGKNKMELALIKITEYWGERGVYADHTLGEYIVVKEEDFDTKLRGLRKVCKKYEDWDEVDEYVYKNFKTVEYYTSTIEIN